MFFWELEVSEVNAFILRNGSRPLGAKALKQRNFRRHVIESLVGDIRNTRKRGRPSVQDDEVRLVGKLHVTEFLEPRKSKDCSVCSFTREQKERKRTRLYCDTCPNKPGLHPGNCFRIYHTAKRYKQ